MPDDHPPHPDFQLIRPPDRPDPARPAVPAIFLSGTNTATTAFGSAASPPRPWRDALASTLRRLPVALVDPTNPAWDKTWAETDLADPRFRSQVEWELVTAAAADAVVVWLGSGAPGPVSLLELGAAAGRRQALAVGCEPGFWKRGHVLALCASVGVACAETLDELRVLVLEIVSAGRGAGGGGGHGEGH